MVKTRSPLSLEAELRPQRIPTNADKTSGCLPSLNPWLDPFSPALLKWTQRPPFLGSSLRPGSPMQWEATVKPNQPAKRLLDEAAVPRSRRLRVRAAARRAPASSLSPTARCECTARAAPPQEQVQIGRGRACGRVGLRARGRSARTRLPRAPPGTAPHARRPRSAPVWATGATGGNDPAPQNAKQKQLAMAEERRAFGRRQGPPDSSTARAAGRPRRQVLLSVSAAASSETM